MTEQEIEIAFLRKFALELLDENDHLRSKLKKARKEKKRFKKKYLELRGGSYEISHEEMEAN